MRRIVSTIIVFIALAIYSLPSFAVGIGGYFNTGYGKYSWEPSYSPESTDGWFFTNPPAKIYPYLLGGGLVIDSNLSEDRIFNVRFNLGFESLNSRKISQKGADICFTFGLAPVRTKLIRLWLGPVIFNYLLWGNDNFHSYTISIFGSPFPDFPVKFKNKYTVFHFGTGAAIGVNFNLPRNITLSIEVRMMVSMGIAGYMYSSMFGDNGIFSSGYSGYCGLSIFYRVNE